MDNKKNNEINTKPDIAPPAASDNTQNDIDTDAPDGIEAEINDNIADVEECTPAQTALSDADFELIETDADAEEYTPAQPYRRRKIFTRENIRSYRFLGLCFLVPALTMWLIYISMGTYPFGNGSVLVLDLNGQYIYFFEQLREIVLGGASFIYSFGRALGGEFMGIYAYYLASPFSFIVCLFPKEMITEALLLMFLLKVGSCGLTFGIYLKYKTPAHKLNRTAIILFSTMYALTSYAVVQQHNTMWIDNLILLPLIILGIERMIKYHRFKLFVISLTIAVLSNFYIGYMMCIFVFFYFFICYFTIAPEERNPSDESAHFVKSFLRMAGSAVMVVLMSAVMIWSAYYALTFGKTTFSNPNYSFSSKFDLLDLISKLFIGSYDTVRPEGLPFVYCGTLAIILIPLYFIIKKIPIREKISSAITVIFFVFCFSGSTIDLVWHGFQKPNWLNYRYSFILCFFMIFIAYRAFLYIKEVDIRAVILDVAFWVMMLVILQKLDTYEWISDYGTVWLSFAFFAVYLLLLRYHINSMVRDGISIAIASVVVLECFVGGLLNLVALGDDVVYSKRTSYRDFIDRIQPIVDMVQAEDDSFYRMEKTVHRKTNDPMALGFRGLSNSTSTLNADTIKFLRELGLSSKSHWSKYLGGTPVLDMLLGVKYLVAEEGDNVSDLYELVYNYDPGNDKQPLEAYKNPYALPIAYGVNKALLSYGMDMDDSPLVRMNSIITEMLGAEENLQLFVPIDITSSDYDNVSLTFTSGHRVYTRDSENVTGKVNYSFTAATDGEIYCYFPSEYLRECDLYLNGSKLSSYFGNETYRVIDLGNFKAGEEIEVSLHTTEKDKLYIMTQETYFYYIDEEAYIDAAAELADGGIVLSDYTEDSFHGKITVSEGDELIFTTIPYDEGWNITVDGEDAELIKALDAVIAFEVEPGVHTITMEYRPDCVIYGRLISLFGLILFSCVATVDFILRRRRG